MAARGATDRIHGAAGRFAIAPTNSITGVSIRSACTINIAGSSASQANCQVTVSLSIANHSASLPVAYRLYLPTDWTKDRVRRKKAGVPSKIGFKTKPEIALEQIQWACEAGLPRGVALMDVAYGNDSRAQA